jgi:F-type H+-transporting ATPase subunit delta
MSELITLARPYARAAFAYAQEAGQIEQWERKLAEAAALAAAPQVRALFSDPEQSRDDLVKLIAGDEADESLVNFLHLLADNDRLQLLPEIHQLFSQYAEEAARKLTVDVYAASDLTAEQLEKLKQALGARLNREIEVRTHKDDSLIGGARIQAGDLVIDGTLKGKLDKLRSELLN